MYITLYIKKKITMIKMECSKQVIVKNKIPFLFLILLACIISCSSAKPVVTNKQPDIVSIYESEGDEIKDLGNGWFEVVGKAIIQNITPEEAEDQAVFNACRDAIQYYSGVEISERILDLQAASQNKIILEHFSSLSKQTTSGIILEKHIMHKEIKTDGENLVKLVVLKVKVGKQKGKKDPYFNVAAHLNRDIFKEGEELELTVQSSKDCYITVLNICSDDSVYILFPNQYRSNNFIKAGEFFKLPNEHDRAMGLSFPTRLRKGKDRDVEMIKILATKEDISLTGTHTLSSYGTYQFALKKLLNWLIKIPCNEIEEIDMQYFIRKDREN